MSLCNLTIIIQLCTLDDLCFSISGLRAAAAAPAQAATSGRAKDSRTHHRRRCEPSNMVFWAIEEVHARSIQWLSAERICFIN